MRHYTHKNNSCKCRTNKYLFVFLSKKGFFQFFSFAYPSLFYVFFYFSKIKQGNFSISLATWRTSCSMDYSNIEYTVWAVEQKQTTPSLNCKQTAPSHNCFDNPCAFFSFSKNKHSLQPIVKKVQGHQERATQKQQSFYALFNFFGRMHTVVK